MKQRKQIARKAYAAAPGPLIGLGVVSCINSMGLVFVHLFNGSPNSALYIGLSQLVLLLIQPLTVGYLRFVYRTYLGQQPSAKELFYYCSSLKLLKKTYWICILLNAPDWLGSWLLYAEKQLHIPSGLSLIPVALLLYLVFYLAFSILTFLSLYIFIDDSERDIVTIFKESARNIKGYVLDLIFLGLWATVLRLLLYAVGFILNYIIFRHFAPNNLFLSIYELIGSLPLEPYIQLVTAGFAADMLGVKTPNILKKMKSRSPAKAGHK